MRIERLGWIGAKGAAAHCAGGELTTASGGAVAGLRRRRPSGARFGSGLGRGASSRRGELVGRACAGRRGDGGLVRRNKTPTSYCAREKARAKGKMGLQRASPRRETPRRLELNEGTTERRRNTELRAPSNGGGGN